MYYWLGGYILVGLILGIFHKHLDKIIPIKECQCGKDYTKFLDENSTPGKIVFGVFAVLLLPIVGTLAMLQSLRYRWHRRSCLIGIVKDV